MQGIKAAAGRLALAAAIPLLVSACGGEGDAPGTASAPAARSQRNPARSSAAPGSESLDLEAMLAPVPEYDGSGRNLFVYGPEPRPQVERPVARPAQPAPAPAPPPPQPRPRPTPQAAPSRIDVKYAGFLEKTTADGTKAKYAIFLDGNEILAGAEGETVANRFTIVEIGLESVTVSGEGTDATERIPLRSN